ncbi:MAG: nucleotidyltransferase domain-containing protein [Patescibacteria group bacterium]|nr:nucleotidyltransferase domain-containing protein [Patescibacteria group bacterium]
MGSVEVLVFGSIVKGKFSPQSDIDVLIISENLPENQTKRDEIRTKIKGAIDPFSPFQIYLATPKEYQNWYQKFLKEDFEKI